MSVGYSYSFGAPRPVVRRRGRPRRRVVLAYPVPTFHPLHLAGHLAEQTAERVARSGGPLPPPAEEPPGGSSPKSAPSKLPNGNGNALPGNTPPDPLDAPSHVFSKNSVDDERSKNSKPPADPVDFASVSSVSSRDSSTNSRGWPGHWRNFLTMRSHLRRTTPFSSGAVRHEYCARRDWEGGKGRRLARI